MPACCLCRETDRICTNTLLQSISPCKLCPLSEILMVEPGEAAQAAPDASEDWSVPIHSNQEITKITGSTQQSGGWNSAHEQRQARNKSSLYLQRSASASASASAWPLLHAPAPQFHRQESKASLLCRPASQMHTHCQGLPPGTGVKLSTQLLYVAAAARNRWDAFEQQVGKDLALGLLVC